MEKSSDGTIRNPIVGAWKTFNECEGVICTTGFPFSFCGTVKPLLIRVAEGGLKVPDVLEDTFALSQLCWPVPDRCMRLSIDLKLCDDNLRSNAGATDDDEGQFGEDDDFDAGLEEAYATESDQINREHCHERDVEPVARIRVVVGIFSIFERSGAAREETLRAWAAPR